MAFAAQPRPRSQGDRATARVGVRELERTFSRTHAGEKETKKYRASTRDGSEARAGYTGGKRARLRRGSASPRAAQRRAASDERGRSVQCGSRARRTRPCSGMKPAAEERTRVARGGVAFRSSPEPSWTAGDRQRGAAAGRARRGGGRTTREHQRQWYAGRHAAAPENSHVGARTATSAPPPPPPPPSPRRARARDDRPQPRAATAPGGRRSRADAPEERAARPVRAERRARVAPDRQVRE